MDRLSFPGRLDSSDVRKAQALLDNIDAAKIALIRALNERRPKAEVLECTEAIRANSGELVLLWQNRRADGQAQSIDVANKLGFLELERHADDQARSNTVATIEETYDPNVTTLALTKLVDLAQMLKST